MSEISQIESRLRVRRRDLQSELDRLMEPPREGAGVGFGKRVGDGTTEAVERLASTATARSIHSSIGDIDKALEKIEQGTYGVCDRCGEPIGLARLEALPASTMCIECASA